MVVLLRVSQVAMVVALRGLMLLQLFANHQYVPGSDVAHCSAPAGSSQVAMTVLCGFVQLQLPCSVHLKTQALPPGYYRGMLLIGALT